MTSARMMTKAMHQMDLPKGLRSSPNLIQFYPLTRFEFVSLGGPQRKGNPNTQLTLRVEDVPIPTQWIEPNTLPQPRETSSVRWNARQNNVDQQVDGARHALLVIKILFFPPAPSSSSDGST